MAPVQKIAILGGGAGAVAAAFYLSGQPHWRERFDITIYQHGWRLGGKGASGRSAQLAQRIGQQGFHLWFGFYANAFAMVRAAYVELGRQPGAPLAAWDEAFRPQDDVALAEPAGRTWRLLLPRHSGEPGTGSDPVTPLYLAGDRVRTGLNALCVEAAVMAGMQASRVLSGYPEKIEADSDFPDEGNTWATS